MEVLGIDIGGSGIKGAIVNTATGEMITERFRIPTPKGRNPKKMAKVIQEIVKHFDYKGPVGCGFPTIVKHGVCKSNGNLDPSWLQVNIEELFSKETGLAVTVINDADAAGYATMNYGIGKGKKGLVGRPLVPSDLRLINDIVSRLFMDSWEIQIQFRPFPYNNFSEYF